METMSQASASRRRQAVNEVLGGTVKAIPQAVFSSPLCRHCWHWQTSHHGGSCWLCECPGWRRGLTVPTSVLIRQVNAAIIEADQPL